MSEHELTPEELERFHLDLAREALLQQRASDDLSAFQHDIRRILQRGEGTLKRPVTVEILRFARLIGADRLRIVRAEARGYRIEPKPIEEHVQKAQETAIETMLAEMFVREVFDLTDEMGSRGDALVEAAERVYHGWAKPFFRDDPSKLRPWRVVEKRALEKRFNRCLKILEGSVGYVRNPGLATLPARPPKHSLANAKAKAGRKRKSLGVDK